MIADTAHWRGNRRFGIVDLTDWNDKPATVTLFDARQATGCPKTTNGEANAALGVEPP
jgi:hypothetical protein